MFRLQQPAVHKAGVHGKDMSKPVPDKLSQPDGVSSLNTSAAGPTVHSQWTVCS